MSQAHEGGYTLLELLLTISVSSILLLAISDYVGVGILGSNQDYNKTLVISNAKQAVETISRTVRIAKTVEANNSQPDSHSPGAPGNLYSWSGTAGNGSTLILAIPSHDTSGNLIYIDGAHTTPYTDDVIFYLDTTSHRLYRRTLANQSAPSNAAITTCPPSVATPTCPPDSDVVDDVANLVTSYLDRSGGTPTTPTGTESVKFTVTESRTIMSRVFTGSYTTIATLRNK